MSLETPSLTILSEEQKFNGDNLMAWNINMTQLLGSKGLTGYVDGNIAKPGMPSLSTSTPDPTPIYSTKPNYDKWVFRDQLAWGHITLNCTDVAGLSVVTTGTAKEAWDSIQEEWGKSTDMRRSHAQEAPDSLCRRFWHPGALEDSLNCRIHLFMELLSCSKVCSRTSVNCHNGRLKPSGC